ncbi:hypothetical protein O6H91_05G129700 [Diphasiastrum complanatum]|nr:hypothetical protein O6H91_05G129700 [Diphasiastrum complanatum]
MEEAVKLYEQLRKSGWQPDSVTCGTMANVFAKMDDHWAIEKLYWDMKEIGVEPNVVYYNTYIQALSRSGRLTLAANTFKQMEEAGIQPTSVTLTILIEMYTRVGAIQKAFEVFERLQREGLVVDVIVYNSLISACAEHSLVTEAESLFDRIYEQGSRPNEGTYRCMMSVYASKGMVKEVRDIFEWLEADGYNPGSQAYTSLIRACKQALEFDKVPEYFNEMISRGCVPNEWLCGSLLACFSMCKPGDVHRSILDCVKRCNPKVHDIVEKFLDSQHVEADWLQEKLANVISEFQLDTRRPLLNSLIDICWQAGRMRESYQILRIGRSLKVYENLETFLDSEWRLNLRTLSFSSAECALESWLNSLYVALYKGQKMPTLLVVETGSGKRRTVEKARLNGFIYSLLKKMDAPFEEDESEIGIFKATCSALKPWLESRKGYPLQDFVGFRHEANTDFHDLSLNTF